LTTSNISYNYTGVNSLCSPISGNCAVNELVTFKIDTFGGYLITCASHSYTWTIDGAFASNAGTFNKQFLTAGDHPVTVNINNGTTSIDMSFTVHVGSSNQPPPNQPPPVLPPPTQPPPVLPPSGCAILTTSNISYNYTNAGGTCSPIGGTCGVGEPVTFNVDTFGGYNINCGAHTYTWTISGVVASQQRSFIRSFPNAGDFPVQLTVSNGGTPFTQDFTVHVGGSSQPPTTPPPIQPPVGQCGVMNNNTLVMKYTGPTSGCNELGGNCQSAESVAFKVTDIHPGYDFSCAVHKFTWTFGDGTAPVVAGSAVSHPYLVAGDYPVTVKVEQGSTFFIAATAIHVRAPMGSGGTPITTFDFSVAPYYVLGIRVPNGYVFTPFAEPTVDTVIWNWNFGDGSTGSSSDYKGVPHVFPDDQDHTVTLASPQSSETHSHNLKVRRRPGR
ncbi:MAG: outer rane adhesin like protein, partial [Acidobacteria bacterium]|nr:outer rane adhesin like protein [Acidobacteriota bacterium]